MKVTIHYKCPDPSCNKHHEDTVEFDNVVKLMNGMKEAERKTILLSALKGVVSGQNPDDYLTMTIAVAHAILADIYFERYGDDFKYATREFATELRSRWAAEETQETALRPTQHAGRA